MISSTERQLRKLGLFLTALLLVQVLWSGAQLIFRASPDPIFPAESSLTVEQMRLSAGPAQSELEALANRPVFWDGRTRYSAPVAVELPAEEVAEPSGGSLENFTLVGTYGVGEDAGVIVAHNGTRYRLRLEEAIEGWKLAHVNGDQVIFEKGFQFETLQLQQAPVNVKANNAKSLRDSLREEQSSIRARRSEPTWTSAEDGSESANGSADKTTRPQKQQESSNGDKPEAKAEPEERQGTWANKL